MSIRCDECYVVTELATAVSWWAKCKNCTRLLLAPHGTDYKYVKCSKGNFVRLKASSTWFSCNCCNREQLVGSEVVTICCGLKVFSASGMYFQLDKLTKEVANQKALLASKDSELAEMKQALVKQSEEKKENFERAEKMYELLQKNQELEEEIEKLRSKDSKAMEMAEEMLRQVAETLAKKIEDGVRNEKVLEEKLKRLTREAEDKDVNHKHQMGMYRELSGVYRVKKEVFKRQNKEIEALNIYKDQLLHVNEKLMEQNTMLLKKLKIENPAKIAQAIKDLDEAAPSFPK